MAANPVPVLIIIFIVLVFEAMIAGEELVEESFPEPDEDAGDGGIFGIVTAVGAVLEVIWGTVVYLFNLITFNVGGAPWWVRVPVGVAIGGSLAWAVMTLIRGS